MKVPLADGIPVLADQCQPERDIRRAIAVPIVRRRDTCVQTAAAPIRHIAKEGEVGREVQRVEILLLVGQPVFRQAQAVQCDHFGAVRYQVRNVAYCLLGVECYHEQRVHLCRGQIGYRLGRTPEDCFS